MSHLPGKFVWCEHVSNDLAKARAFYEPLFGWHVERVTTEGQSYEMVMNRNTGLGGLRAAQPGERSGWVSYVSVPDVDTSFERALKAGAQAVQAPTDYGPVGRGAALIDPTGAVLSLWKGAEGDPVDVEKTPVGGWTWFELWTADAVKALAFYTSALGYTSGAQDFGTLTYHVLNSADGRPRAGLFQATDQNPQAPTMWLPYVEVADCDAAAARAQQLGGEVVVPPTDIPNVGRYAVLVDMQGASIGIIRSQ